MREENDIAKRRYYFDQINLVKGYIKGSPKIQKKKWVQLEWSEHVNPHEVKAVLEESVKGLYSVTTADSDDSRYLKLEPCFWLENKDDIIMMLLKGGFKMGGKLIAVSIKRRVKATDEE
ncbi:hypothetical protein H261_00075 [Paramagnetospirillum caucaseum]|uniref:Uncharacterized protein n=2 Tax=Paramagnetospirillum caucaseum TaxID=1244869 RepID=M3AGD2_9PROT|nr:hypothetical protein H261_00075 [Paramagnetospirillum caucaseum]